MSYLKKVEAKMSGGRLPHSPDAKLYSIFGEDLADELVDICKHTMKELESKVEATLKKHNLGDAKDDALDAVHEYIETIL